MPRVPYAPKTELPTKYNILHEQEADLHENVTAKWWNSQGTVRTFGNNPALAETHVYANVSMWTESGLTPAEVEYVILSVAREMESSYIWQDHVRLGDEHVGLCREELLAISRKETESMSDEKAALVKYTLELVREYGEVSAETHELLSEYYNESTVVGIAMLSSYYVFLHHASTALGIPNEDEFCGWELENYEVGTS